MHFRYFDLFKQFISKHRCMIPLGKLPILL
jgi:hypothetical protein